MKTKYYTVGKGQWQREEIEHIPNGGIEKTILDLLERLEIIDYNEWMDGTTYIDDLWDNELLRRETKSELYAILA